MSPLWPQIKYLQRLSSSTAIFEELLRSQSHLLQSHVEYPHCNFRSHRAIMWMHKIKEKMAYTMGALKSHEDLVLCNRRPPKSSSWRLPTDASTIVGRKWRVRTASIIRVLSKVSSIVLSELRRPENRGQAKSYLYIKIALMSDPLCIQRIEQYDGTKAFEQEHYQPGMKS